MQLLPTDNINAFRKNTHLLWIFFEGISSDCILSEYVIEQLCRGLLQDAGRSFGGLLDYVVVSKKESIGNTVHLYKIIHVVIASLSTTVFL